MKNDSHYFLEADRRRRNIVPNFLLLLGKLIVGGSYTKLIEIIHSRELSVARASKKHR